MPKFTQKPLFSTAHPYSLGPGLIALSPRSGTLGADTLIHRRIKIRSLFPRTLLLETVWKIGGGFVERGFWQHKGRSIELVYSDLPAPEAPE